jgi:Skp family chaperone for outer membrane proteins
MTRAYYLLAAGAAVSLGLALSSAHAAAPKVEAAAKTFASIEGHAGKLKTFCDMFKTMTAAETEQDEKKAQKMEEDIDAKMKDLGKDFTDAWELQAELDAESADGKTYYAAADKLMGKCPKQ